MTTFQQRVLEIVSQVPKGKVITYKQLAEALNTKAYQAIGQALKINPTPIQIPCHRVVRSDLQLGGYLGDQIEKKRKLLTAEGVDFLANGRVTQQATHYIKR